ncbi:SHC-transforming protein 3-like [Carassius auratus]|uniref:SHC-transforming protein 3-like n=1 Tax=Carassius auratus TaxID=7957 RepID=A0A6P6IZY2_CARAU|nr:SHC-transforming protein 3-like [Carassius auratus]
MRKGSCCMFTSGVVGALLLIAGIGLFVSGFFQTLIHNKLKGWLTSLFTVSAQLRRRASSSALFKTALTLLQSLKDNARSRVQSLPKRGASARPARGYLHLTQCGFRGSNNTTDYVAYVAKDPVNRRACHIVECSDGLAQDVISTIGQAFDLRFQIYLQCPSSKPSSMHDRGMSTDEPPWTEEGEESADHHYYNSIPGKMPPPGGFIDTRLTNQTQDGCQAAGVDQTYYQGRPMFIQQGSCDIYSLPEVKGQAPKAGEVPTYVNTQHIDTQVLAALQGESETLSDSGTGGTAKDSPRKDLFDMKPFEDAIMTQTPASELHKAASVDNSSPLLMRAAALRAQEELEDQTWYHGEMSRRQAEKLLLHDGDFLVRKSTTNPGSYVLTGMHHGLAKHLLLVDPEGTVRTKDHIFESISHLIGHHRDNNLPIVSAGSELCLKQPVDRKQ